MKLINTTILFYLLFLQSFALSAPSDKSLGQWHKDDEHGFWIRIPNKWTELRIPKSEKHQLAGWRGPSIKVNIKNIGKTFFNADFRILWISKKSQISKTLTITEPKKDGEKAPKKEITEAERKKLLAVRNSRLVAHSFDQWLNNFSRLTGVRIIGKKERTVAKKPAVEYEFLTKTNRQLNIKHMAVVVDLSDSYEIALLFSVVEEEYRMWKSFFQKCAYSLKISKPNLFTDVADKKQVEKKATKPGCLELGVNDVVITNHGKIIEGKVKEDGEFYIIDLGGPVIKTPKTLIKSVQYGSPESYIPVTDEEKEMAAKGYLKYKGKWVIRTRYDLERKKDLEKLKKKIEELKEHSDPANPWIKRESYFILESTTSEELLNHYADILKAHIKAFEQRFKINITSEARRRKPTVRIFKDRQEYMNFTRAFGSGGYFNFMDNTLHLFHNFEDPSLTEAVLLHEGTHLLNYLSNTDFASRPHWIEEGTAEYFGSSLITIDRWGKLLFEPGQILGNRLLLVHNLIVTKKVNNLRAALATNSYQYKDYAYWWSFVHFMVSNKEYSDRFFKYYRKLYSLKGVKTIQQGQFLKVTPEESVRLFEKSMKIKDWATLQAKWEFFIQECVEQVGGYGWMVLGRDLFFESFKKKAQAEKAGKSEKKKEASESDGKTQADLLAEALDALNKSIDEKGYKKAAAFYYRSQIYKEKKEYQKSLDDINSAIEIDPLNDNYYQKRATVYYLGEEKEQAINNMRIAIALNPLNLVLPLILDEMRSGVFIDLSRG